MISEVVEVDKVVPAKMRGGLIGQCGFPPKYLNASEYPHTQEIEKKLYRTRMICGW